VFATARSGLDRPRSRREGFGPAVGYWPHSDPLWLRATFAIRDPCWPVPMVFTLLSDRRASQRGEGWGRSGRTHIRLADFPLRQSSRVELAPRVAVP
jgi:hypothetical protein